jgi:outer membrane immunogenic protein
MKNVILAVATLVAASGIAVAADMPVKHVAPAMVSAGCANFGGWYAGISGGGTRYTVHRNDDDGYFEDNAGHTVRKSGWNAGVQGGYNWQQRCTVWGVEADWSWNTGKTQFRDEPNIPAIIYTLDSEMRWFGTARTRGGIVVDNVLLYLTGGFAYANVRDVYSNNGFGGVLEQFTFTDTRWGWVGGAGTEWKLGNNWTVKSEVLYMQLNQKRDTIVSVTGAPALFRFTNNDDAFIARLGLNYLFGGGVMR